MIDNVHDNQPRYNREVRFNEIFKKFQPGLCTFANKLVHDLQVAEDIVNDCFANYWKNEYTLDELDEANALLITMVRNGCYYHLRTYASKPPAHLQFDEEKDRLHLDNDKHAADFTELIRDLRIEVEHILETMPAQQALVFKLTYLEGLKRNEVAAKLKISSNTVRNHNAAALKFLRNIFTNRELMVILLFLNIIDN